MVLYLRNCRRTYTTSSTHWIIKEIKSNAFFLDLERENKKALVIIIFFFWGGQYVCKLMPDMNENNLIFLQFCCSSWKRKCPMLSRTRNEFICSRKIFIWKNVVWKSSLRSKVRDTLRVIFRYQYVLSKYEGDFTNRLIECSYSSIFHLHYFHSSVFFFNSQKSYRRRCLPLSPTNVFRRNETRISCQISE